LAGDAGVAGLVPARQKAHDRRQGLTLPATCGIVLLTIVR
jgi:hypothetical protein